MSELWVLLELVPVVTLALLVGTAGIAHRKGRDEPKWWPDFEREFRVYVARTVREHGSDATAQSRIGRPPAHDRRAAND